MSVGQGINVMGGGCPSFFGPRLFAPREDDILTSATSSLTDWEWYDFTAMTGPTPPPLIQHTANLISWQTDPAILVLGGRDPLIDESEASSTCSNRPLSGWIFNLEKKTCDSSELRLCHCQHPFIFSRQT